MDFFFGVYTAFAIGVGLSVGGERGFAVGLMAMIFAPLMAGMWFGKAACDSDPDWRSR